jgi:hypothetical protein
MVEAYGVATPLEGMEIDCAFWRDADQVVMSSVA